MSFVVVTIDFYTILYLLVSLLQTLELVFIKPCISFLLLAVAAYLFVDLFVCQTYKKRDFVKWIFKKTQHLFQWLVENDGEGKSLLC